MPRRQRKKSIPISQIRPHSSNCDTDSFGNYVEIYIEDDGSISLQNISPDVLNNLCLNAENDSRTYNPFCG